MSRGHGPESHALVLVFSSFFGAAGVLIGQAIGGVVFGLISVVCALRVMRGSEAPEPVEPFAREARLFTLFHHRR